MMSLKQQISVIGNELQWLNSKFKEVSDKMKQVENLEKTMIALQDKNTTYEFNLTTMGAVPAEFHIDLRANNIEWEQLQQCVLKSLDNRKSQLEETISICLDTLKKYISIKE